MWILRYPKNPLVIMVWAPLHSKVCVTAPITSITILSKQLAML